MKIKILPVTHWDSNRGLVTATHAEVHIARHQLGDEMPRGGIELQIVEPAMDGKPERYHTVASGGRDLTPAQFAEWKPADAIYFARAIVINAGLTPAD